MGATALLMMALLAGCGGGGGGDVPLATALGTDAGSGTNRIASAAPAAAGGVMINEVSAGSWKGAVDEDGESQDWVELYNPGSTPVDLTGYGLSNKTTTPFYWTFPAGTTVAPKGYLTVWLSKKDRATAGSPLHTNFNLDSGADSIYLAASNATATGIFIDSASPPLVKADQSWCRMPNGAVSSAFSVCDQPTFNAANSGGSNPGILAKPTLSIKSGFYAAAQTLALSGPAGATLRYTTDGSEPTAASAAYAAPLSINTSQVVRVAAFAAGAAPSLVETGTYVIGAALASQYATLKAVMVAIEPGDYAAFVANDKTRNFRASFEMITGATTTVFKIDAEGSAGGNAGSADSPIRTMNVTARDAFGAKAFVGALWPDKPGITSSKKLRLRNGSNDWDQAHLRDQFAQRVSADGPNLTSASTSVAMFVNGRYYGLMDLREREEETLPASNLGIDKDYVDYLSDPLLDGQEIKNGGDAALAAYQAMWTFVTGNDMSVPANYARAKTLLNPDSLAYDWALHMFQANSDWPYHNVHVWRSPEVDGRWTWHTHDQDWAFGLYLPVTLNMNASFTGPGSELITALLRNPDFRTLYLNSVADQLNVMTPAFLNSTLDSMAADMRPYIADYFAVAGLGAASNWETRLAEMRTYFTQREAIYDGHNRTQFGLAARQAISVSVNDVSMGSVSVNSIDTRKLVTAAAPTWTGRYYPGVPITLEAKPKPGFAFVGWQGASTATDRRIAQTLVAGATQPVALTAVFVATAAPAAPVFAAVSPQSFRTGDIVSLKVVATDPGGYPVTYSAKTLPKGPNINPASGVIFGRLTTPGTYSSVISATNGVTTGTVTVVWTVVDRAGTGLLGTSPNSGPPPNVPPTVSLSSPASAVTVAPGARLALAASAADADGSVASVEFFDNGASIGVATAAPYGVAYTVATAGTHALTARATDNSGASTTSAAVVVTAALPNAPPTVALTAPAASTLFTQGSVITVSANAADSDGSVARVDFYDGNVLIGSANASPFSIGWSGAAVGAHTLTAKAVDNAGAETVSAAVAISVSAITPPTGTGTGLSAQYFATLDLSGPVVLTRTEAIDFSWGTGSPGAGVPVDFFSARWTGQVEAPTTGAYQFQTNSDDGVRVTVNGQVLIDNFTPHGPTVDTSAAISLTAGQRYSIVVEYQEYSGGATVQLRWKTPSDTAFSAVPASRLYTDVVTPPEGAGTGLLGQYYASLDLTGAVVLSRTEAVNFDWGIASPGAGVPADYFSARWTGFVEAVATGPYQFQTTSDDGVRVYVNGQLVINNFTAHGPTVDTSAAITLTAGQRYSIVVEYQEYTGGATVQLRWQTPGSTAFAAVPASRLYSGAGSGNGTGTGLAAQYFATLDLSGAVVLARTEAVFFNWGTGSPDASLPADFFSARWTGYVEAPSSGMYQFQTTSDDGVRVYVNGQLVIDDFTPHGPTVDTSAAITLTAGQRYSIVVEYQEYTGGALMQLAWKTPGSLAFVAVPASRLYVAP